MPFSGMTVIAKASADPSQLVAALRQQVTAIDPDQPIYNIRTMDEIRAQSVAPERLNLTLLSIFPGIALVLAIVVIYAVTPYTDTQRPHQICIRLSSAA